MKWPANSEGISFISFMSDTSSITKKAVQDEVFRLFKDKRVSVKEIDCHNVQVTVKVLNTDWLLAK